MIKEQTVEEREFYGFHERLKSQNRRIIRCMERVSSKGRYYTFVWIEA